MPELKTFYSEAGDSAQLSLGFGDKHGKLVLRTPWIEQTQGGQTREHSLAAITLDGKEVSLKMGAHQFGSGEKLGRVDLQTIVLDANEPEIRMGGEHRGEGKLTLNNRRGSPAIEGDASNGQLNVGTNGTDGMLQVKDKNNAAGLQFSASNGRLRLGTPATPGQISLRGAGGDRVRIDADSATITAGGRSADGRVTLSTVSGVSTVDLVAKTGSLRLGGGPAGGGTTGVNGDISLVAATGEESIRLSGGGGQIVAGGVGVNGDIDIRNSADITTILVNGKEGDIVFKNADLAEEFAVEPGADVLSDPGTVMTLSNSGKLVPCHQPHDQKVIGIVAGAGGYKPAMVLDQAEGRDRVAVTMVGKAYCKATAAAGSIQVGDLLTTSAVMGHAQRVCEPGRAIGTVIGKALGSLDVQSGLIPVLVNLQ